MGEVPKNVLDHEGAHLIGQYGLDSTYRLLSEGYTELSISSKNGQGYKKSRFMNILLAETFGSDTLKKGYYRFDLPTALVNRIVLESGEDENKARKEVNKLLQNCETFLRESATYTRERNDRAFNQIFMQLNRYYRELNNRDISDNLIAELIANYFVGEDSKLLKPGEAVYGLAYCDLDNGTAVFNVTTPERAQEGDIPSGFEVPPRVMLNKFNKYNRPNKSDTDYPNLINGYLFLTLNPSDNNAFMHAQLMNAMLSLTFGKETIDKGYVEEFDLPTALSNKVVQVTGQDSKSTKTEISGLIENIESYLNKVQNDPTNPYNYQEEFEGIYSKLGQIYRTMTGEEIDQDPSANLLKSYFEGENSINGVRVNDAGEVVLSVGQDYCVNGETGYINITPEHVIKSKELDDLIELNLPEEVEL